MANVKSKKGKSKKARAAAPTTCTPAPGQAGGIVVGIEPTTDPSSQVVDVENAGGTCTVRIGTTTYHVDKVREIAIDYLADTTTPASLSIEFVAPDPSGSVNKVLIIYRPGSSTPIATPATHTFSRAATGVYAIYVGTVAPATIDNVEVQITRTP